MPILKHEINSERREHYEFKVNKPLMKAITFLGNLFPDPLSDEYVIFHPNAKRLVEILKKYNQFDANEHTRGIVNSVARVVITALERSPNWRDRIGFFAEELRAGEWRERAYNHPKYGWNEPKPYGRGSKE